MASRHLRKKVDPSLLFWLSMTDASDSTVEKSTVANTSMVDFFFASLRLSAWQHCQSPAPCGARAASHTIALVLHATSRA